DELGRTVEAGHLGFDGSWITTFTELDVHGNVTRSSIPAAAGGTQAWLTSTYDRLGQALLERLGTKPAPLHEHSLLFTRSIDPEGHVSYQRRDVTGRLIESGHFVGTSTTPIGEVRFTYAAFDNVETVIGAEGHVTRRG